MRVQPRGSMVQDTPPHRPVDLAVGVVVERVAVRLDGGAAGGAHVRPVDVGPAPQPQPVAEPGQGADRLRDDDVGLLVVEHAVRGQRRAAADGPAEPDADLQHPTRGQRSTVHPHGQRPAGSGEAGRHAADQVRQPAEARLQRRRLPCRLRADAEVHRVDHHAAGVVDEQVESPGTAVEHHPRGRRRVERQADRAGQIVAGAERDQPDRSVQPVGPVQRLDDGVHAAVAAADHQPPFAQPRDRRVARRPVTRWRPPPRRTPCRAARPARPPPRPTRRPPRW